MKIFQNSCFVVCIYCSKVGFLGAWPWLSAIAIGDDEGFQFTCAGALISDRYILTAAHCVYDKSVCVKNVFTPILEYETFGAIYMLPHIFDLFDYRDFVRIGDHNLYDDYDVTFDLDVLVKNVIVHPKYNNRTYENDIVLLKLDHPVIFTSN